MLQRSSLGLITAIVLSRPFQIEPEPARQILDLGVDRLGDRLVEGDVIVWRWR
jgi:hypothetical protein